VPTTRTEELLAVSRSPLESTFLWETGSVSTPTAFPPGSASVPLEAEPSPVLSPASAGSSSDPDGSSEPGSSDLAPVSPLSTRRHRAEAAARPRARPRASAQLQDTPCAGPSRASRWCPAQPRSSPLTAPGLKPPLPQTSQVRKLHLLPINTTPKLQKALQQCYSGRV
jgi:hypothetical protein